MTTKKYFIYRCCVTLLICLMQMAGIAVYGQDVPRAALKRTHPLQPIDSVQLTKQVQMEDSLRLSGLQAGKADSLSIADSLAAENRKKMLELTSAPSIKDEPVPYDSLHRAVPLEQWVPNPTKATWLALVIPGGGQIYNRKFWKLPIFYGGFAGCAYALTWNGNMYSDYSDAYRDAVNGNWSSSSITSLLPSGYTASISQSQLIETLRRRKDMYRRYRDLSIFAFIAVYLLSVVDAYVDAELSNFDISPDLSMKVEPAIINQDNQSHMSFTKGKSVGLQCSFRF